MGDDRTTFVCIGAYDAEADAQLDDDVMKGLFGAGVIGTYDAAVIAKDSEGKVRLDKGAIPTRRGARGAGSASARCWARC